MLCYCYLSVQDNAVWVSVQGAIFNSEILTNGLGITHVSVYFRVFLFELIDLAQTEKSD